MKTRLITAIFFALTLIPLLALSPTISHGATGKDYDAVPPFVTSGAPPLVMLVMGRDHKLYYEAYNDASDLNDDGVIDYRYKPNDITYYGYFDNYKCYEYDSGVFKPESTTTTKKCTGANEWSGDFLNYITMSRMDTLRKVLYGGYRATDSTTETILERVYVPQDAHSWGKEYTSTAVDGYDIEDYTPLSQPIPDDGGTVYRHLFCSTTLSKNGTPIFRVAVNSVIRIWEWVSVEGHAGRASKVNPTLPTTSHPGHPSNHTQFEALVTTYAQDNPTYKFGSSSWLDWNARNHSSQKYPSPNATTFGAIDGAGNPFGTDYDPYSANNAEQENYLAIFTGTINIPADEEGTYSFGIDGDDAVELIIDGGTANETIIGYYGAHSTAGSPQGIADVYFSVGDHTIEFRMEEATGGDKYYMYWKKPGNSNYSIVPNTAFTSLTLSTYRLKLGNVLQTLVDYDVKIKVCDPSVGLESNCKQYPNGQYKPIGILQRHGESQKMYFGLISGSYEKNMKGGVLRKNIGDINNEIDTNTGILDSTNNGIIKTINNFKISDYQYSGNNGSYTDCGWIEDSPMDQSNSKCYDWGNPIAEMMYETLRYFAGEGAPTPSYTYSATDTNLIDNELELPLATWIDPYDTTSTDSFETCSQPFMLVLSDINPSFDSDDLPGIDTNFGTGITSGLTGLNVSTLSTKITTEEGNLTGNKFIGQSGATSDGSCSEKSITGLGSIKGLCPEEPTKSGSYYSAAVAHFGHETDLHAADDDQKVTTYAVGLASPLPRIELDVGGKHITLVPFAKTVGSENNNRVFNYWPTNTIVDFYITELGDTYGKFQINYEDVEQGADHDMDDIVEYQYQLVDDAGDPVADTANATKVTITLDSTYASGSYIQHAGYIISGTEKDGSYLEVTDFDTKVIDQGDNDFLVWLDTPPGIDPLDPTSNEATVVRDQPNGPHQGSNTLLTHHAERTFTPSSSSTATPAQLLKNPLWYAAKWGGFEEKDAVGSAGYGKPDSTDEWDKDGDGTPDTYFYVTNPLKLEEQLNKSFAAILNAAASGTAASVISNTRSGEGAIYQSVFFPSKTDSTGDANTISWAGQVHSMLVDAYGNMREDTNQNQRLDVVGPDLNNDNVVYHEDINMNCRLDSEKDTNGNGILDPSEDLNGNGVIDTEDTNDNGLLDVENILGCTTATTPATHPFLKELDAILVFENTKAQLYYDVNGNSVLEDREILWNVGTQDVDSDDINYLWSSTNWLNSNSLAVTTQRTSHISDSNTRYIFTWIDGDSNNLIGTSEIKDFVWPTTNPTTTALKDVTSIYPYLHLYPSFANRPTAISDIISDDAANSTSNFDEFLIRQTERQINYIRGLDDVDSGGNSQILSLYDDDATAGNEVNVAGTELRSRKYNGKTWRLGDIAYSTPTVVGKPSENYHLLYRDGTFATYAKKNQDRRNVIYAGANDGMVHAFNGGFYDGYSKQFCKEINATYDPYDNSVFNDVACDSTSTMPEIGAELWGYVPFNLLPHLYWLTEPGYEHSYYVDLKPRIFDAKIFPADSICTFDLDNAACVHPDGWGTIMVIGMRFGGASIVADMDKTDGITEDTDDITMKSSYLIFDITNPEQKPTLLGEITMPKMGYSFSYPTLAIMKDGDHDGIFEDYNSTSPEFGENRWFLAFGSGPADTSGDPINTILDTAESTQKGQYYLLDLVKLASEGTLYTLVNDSSTGLTTLTAGLHSYIELEDNSFVDSSISVDYDLDFNADALYFGTLSGTASSGSDYSGKMRRIVIDDKNDGGAEGDDKDPSNWLADSILYNADQPISAAATIAQDSNGRNWIFFGTGRYYVDSDNDDFSLQSYYGIKEPVDTLGNKSWATVAKDDLMNMTDVRVFTDNAHTVDQDGISTTWENIAIQQLSKSGWYIDFMETDDSEIGERNLGQATLLGGLLSYTTFTPSEDPCVASGNSYLWALYYQTGLPYFTGILGTQSATFESTSYNQALNKIHLGEGLATSPNVHVGRQSGSSIFIQSSTGEILKIDQENPDITKSGVQSWRLR